MTVRPPLRVALTGGIATGKSHCLARFAQLGAPTIDADAIAHSLVEPGTPALSAIVARFGAAILLPDGHLDRAGLGRLVFADPAARRDLEHILHPAVYDAIETWFRTSEAFTTPPHPRTGRSIPRAGIADIPLLFETGREKDFDRVVVTTCRPEQQMARLMTRGGLDQEEVRQRLAAQLPLAEKARRADLVIDTSGTRAETDRQVEAVWDAINR